MMKEQFIRVNEDGDKLYYSDRKMKILHREDGPAAEYADGTKLWFIYGKLHREDGPAVEWVSGFKAWYINDKLHREDGPAYEWADGDKSWYINGDYHSEDEFNARMNTITELTLEDIAEKFDVSVDQIKIKK